MTQSTVRRDIARLPRFDELPEVGETGERHSWDVFGRDDEVGCLNFITPERRAAAAQEVHGGLVVNLNLPLGQPQPQFWASRTPLEHEQVVKGNLRDDRLDNVQTHGGTHWDGLRHQRFREFGWYGGRQEHELDDLGEIGIDAWAGQGIIGRGILADVAGFMAERGTPLATDRRFGIDWSLLESVLDSQGLETRPGDVLLIRTGWIGAYLGLPAEAREELGARLNADRSQIELPGLDPGRETVAWLWNHQIAAVALDNPTAETVPYRPDEGWAHQRLIPLLGLTLGELWALDELAATCLREDRYSFLLTSAPFNLPRGSGSPANAYAIF
jgi:kynurenine formamidase